MPANADQHNPVMVDQYIPLMAATGRRSKQDPPPVQFKTDFPQKLLQPLYRGAETECPILSQISLICSIARLIFRHFWATLGLDFDTVLLDNSIILPKEFRPIV